VNADYVRGEAAAGIWVTAARTAAGTIPTGSPVPRRRTPPYAPPGREDGYQDGHNDGYEDGYRAGYAGQAAASRK